MTSFFFNNRFLLSFWYNVLHNFSVKCLISSFTYFCYCRVVLLSFSIYLSLSDLQEQVLYHNFSIVPNQQWSVWQMIWEKQGRLFYIRRLCVWLTTGQIGVHYRKQNKILWRTRSCVRMSNDICGNLPSNSFHNYRTCTQISRFDVMWKFLLWLLFLFSFFMLFRYMF